LWTTSSGSCSRAACAWSVHYLATCRGSVHGASH
jgi:hypothetical protein